MRRPIFLLSIVAVATAIIVFYWKDGRQLREDITSIQSRSADSSTSQKESHLPGESPGAQKQQNPGIVKAEIDPSSGQEEKLFQLTGQIKDSLASEKLDTAASFAEDVLKHAECCKTNWDYGNAIHLGHIALGRFAFFSGDLASAKNQLLEAGKTPGSPQLNSFGPDWKLANDLLHHGERETVLRYIDLCSKFWKDDSGDPRRELAFWTNQIKNGKSPNLTEFVYFPD
ncbi:MAG: hypothetical protein NDJ90_01730 [Oligoflexia bacterium]|nr:hypothetical protein [Oligoflexia bacterium]